MLGNSLKEGVLCHSFSDHSGCVFFQPSSGETLSVKLSELVLTELLSSRHQFNISDENKTVVESLINKGFIDHRAGQ
jgi:hypothetical protein